MEEVTWEEELMLKSKFPTFSLQDKAMLDEGGNDRESTKEYKEERIILEPRHKQPSSKVYSRIIKGTRGKK